MGFQQGLSGLSAASKNLEVIGNNVANSNTYGEKTSRTEFADMYANAMTGSSANNTDAGIGVQVASVSQQFNQGNITPTGNPLDLAINGNGFFQTQDPSNQIQYTRNGQFKVSNEGNTVRVDDATHKGDGGFEITNPATSVTVDILNPAGASIGTVKMGPQEAGRHSFDFDVPDSAKGQPLTFKVSAMNNDKPLDSLSLAYNGIQAVSNVDGKLAVELDNGKRVGYDAVWAFL